MKRFKWVLLVVIIVGLGCATAPTKPISQSDLPGLIGMWRGYMTVPAYGQTNQSADFRSSVELEIFNSSLKGRLTRFFGKSQTERYSFPGKIEDGRLVAYWKNGGWMKMNLRQGNAKMELEGDYEFPRISGSIVLKKVQ